MWPSARWGAAKGAAPSAVAAGRGWSRGRGAEGSAGVALALSHRHAVVLHGASHTPLLPSRLQRAEQTGPGGGAGAGFGGGGGGGGGHSFDLGPTSQYWNRSGESIG